MITIFLIDSSGVIRAGGQELLEQWCPESGMTIWIDFQYRNTSEAASLLERFHIHPLVIEDALRTRHPPKIEFFDDQLFILYRGIAEIHGALDFTHQQIGLFIGKNFVISLHNQHSPGIAKAQSKLDTTKLKTPLQIAINIMRYASFMYLENVLEFENRLSVLEDDIQTRGNDQLLAELTLYKSKLLKLIRSFNYHASISRALLVEAEEYDFLAHDRHLHAINDLNDRFDRLVTLSQMHYDICGDLIDGYLSISAHQLNVTMRVLTVITAIFVPLSFLAGLYGMNFDYIPELKYPNGYFILIGVMCLLACSLLFFFKKKRWL